eukprot:11512004-Alexandrium_andersonii.AAC.1
MCIRDRPQTAELRPRARIHDQEQVFGPLWAEPPLGPFRRHVGVGSIGGPAVRNHSGWARGYLQPVSNRACAAAETGHWSKH